MGKEKNIKDYLHLYLGCECLLHLELGTMSEKLTGVTENEDGETICYFLNSNKSFRKSDTVKLLLRPLSDMTEEEKKEYGKGKSFINVQYLSPADFMYLLLRHFDVFGLIESGLAIDKEEYIKSFKI